MTDPTIIEAAARALFNRFTYPVVLDYPPDMIETPCGEAVKEIITIITPMIRAQMLEEAAQWLKANAPFQHSSELASGIVRALKEQS